MTNDNTGSDKNNTTGMGYRMGKMVYHGMKHVIPLNMRLALKKEIPVSLIKKVWSKPDVTEWPLPENKNINGWEKYEYSVWSQNGEDGLIRYIFDQIGYQSKYFIEIGFEVTECNTLRLMLIEKLDGILIDGATKGVKKFNKAAAAMGITNVKAVAQFLNCENLQSTIEGAGAPKEVDLLSIDVDGNDYWFWETIDFITARLVIVEINSSLGPDRSMAVPYDPAYLRHEKHPSGFYCSASLTAFNKLAEKKGYSLVGCDSNGVNAFFVRNDCMKGNLKKLTPQEAFRPHRMRINRGFSQEDQYNTIKDMPYVEI
ncbi:MAG: hypothetical protein KDC05_01435 [Bacteroidales bacterium]|nr:hypothetical protein [Bacteroidales bacterium]